MKSPIKNKSPRSSNGRAATLAALPVSILGFLPGEAQSATITGVTIQDVSTELGGSFNRLANYTVDGSGFDESTGFHTLVPDASMWLNNGSFTAPNDPNLPGAIITFNLGALYDLNSLTVWNYNEMIPGRPDLLMRGANDVEILVADSEVGEFISLGDFNFAIAPGLDSVDFGQQIDLTGFAAADNAWLVRFNITSNHDGDNNFIGLSEVRFDAVPEPSAALLALVGLLGPVGLRRRR